MRKRSRENIIKETLHTLKKKKKKKKKKVQYLEHPLRERKVEMQKLIIEENINGN